MNPFDRKVRRVLFIGQILKEVVLLSNSDKQSESDYPDEFNKISFEVYRLSLFMRLGLVGVKQ